MDEETWKAWVSCWQDERLLSLLRELFGYLAHEINNPLTSILGYATLLLRTCNPCCLQRQELDLICQEALRVRAVVWEFLSFVEQAWGDLQTVDLNELLRKTVEELRKQINQKEVEFKEEYCQDLPEIAVNAVQMKNVFLYLLNHAVEAVPGRGMVTVVTRFKETNLEIEVFHPFFTAKEGGAESGLGLTISREVISRHRGRLEFFSEAGKGTSFLIRLPVNKDEIT